MKTAETILRIPVSRPELLFTGDEAAVHRLYQRLASTWHPDRNADPRATEVFQRVASLYAAAKQQIGSGRWRSVSGETMLEARDGRQYRIKHFSRRPFELGELLIGKAFASFVIRSDAADLYAAAVRMLGMFSFGSDAMRQQILPALPEAHAALDGPTYHALIIKKPADMVLLADLADYLGGPVPAAHVAWILSALYNLACWLEWAQISHNAIGLDTVFVSPERHAIALLGGWWYAAPVGRRLSALPARTVETIPQDIVRSKVADARSDLELIRATGRELLGDASGSRLVREPSIPRGMADWLRHSSSGSAVTDYALWRDVLVDAWGARRFSRLDVTLEQIYSTP